MSVLAGERFCDRPRTAHPALASLARAVNDLVSDPVRPSLSLLASDLVGTAAAGYDADPVIAELVATTAKRLHPSSALARNALRSAKARARRQGADNRVGKLLLRATAGGYRARVVDQVAQMVADDIARSGDRELVAVLETATAECRRRADAAHVVYPGRTSGVGGRQQA